ncbi:MAG: DUF3093 domain-containing protein [Candidatus Planktophila sp.]|nr:DUF3093 domain-containing protein [Candidatus Planktophila sp.]
MRFREVIRAPFWLLTFIYFPFLSLVVAVWAAIGNQPAFITWVVSTVLIVLIALKSSLVLEIDESELRAGTAHIGLNYVGKATALDSKEMGRLRTRDADPASYLIFRFWRSTGVKVEINDPRDQTPYWLITSKRNAELVKILNG